MPEVGEGTKLTAERKKAEEREREKEENGFPLPPPSLLKHLEE